MPIMKNILLLALLFASFGVSAQSWKDSTMTFTCKVATALQIRQIVSNDEVRASIASATDGTTDTTVSRPIVVTQGQMREIYDLLCRQPVGLVRRIVDE